MSDRKPSPFAILLNNDVCSLIQAAEDVYQIRFKNRAANAYLVRGKSRTIMIDVGLSSNYPALLECLDHLGCPPDKIAKCAIGQLVVALDEGHRGRIGRRNGIEPGRYDAKLTDKKERTCIVRNIEIKGGRPYAFSIEEGDLKDCGC